MNHLQRLELNIEFAQTAWLLCLVSTGNAGCVRRSCHAECFGLTYFTVNGNKVIFYKALNKSVDEDEVFSHVSACTWEFSHLLVIPQPTLGWGIHTGPSWFSSSCREKWPGPCWNKMEGSHTAYRDRATLKPWKDPTWFNVSVHITSYIRVFIIVPTLHHSQLLTECTWWHPETTCRMTCRTSLDPKPQELIMTKRTHREIQIRSGDHRKTWQRYSTLFIFPFLEKKSVQKKKKRIAEIYLKLPWEEMYSNTNYYKCKWRCCSNDYVIHL